MRILFLLLLSALYGTLSAQIISGVVYEVGSKEVLPGSSVSIANAKYATSTDVYGYFNLWLPDCDSVEVIVSCIGYRTLVKMISCIDATQDYYLEPTVYDIEEVYIEGHHKNTDSRSEVATFKLSPVELNSMPAIFGEKDPLRYFQLTPGVQLAGDFNSNLYVRGGGHDQNLFLLDDMPLYHVTHLGGFISSFNADIIKNAALHKGAFPAQYGGRLSSVVDVRTNDGDMSQHNWTVMLGFIISKISVNGPIKKDKSSYLFSVRKNTIPFFKWFADSGLAYNMYDVNLKLNRIITPNDRIYFSFYNGIDGMKQKVKAKEDVDSKIRTGWGNIAGTLRYYKKISSVLSANLIVGHSTYYYTEKANVKFQAIEEQNMHYNRKFNSAIHDNFFVAKLNYELMQHIRFLSGYEFHIKNYQPGKSLMQQSGMSEQSKNYPYSRSVHHNPFAEFVFADILGFNARLGIRLDATSLPSGKQFINWQPRISLSQRVFKIFTIKASYAVMIQDHHLLSNSSGGIPVDYRIPVLETAPPSSSKQWTAGLTFSPEENTYELSLEGFYKDMDDLVDLKDGVDFTHNFSSWNKILATNGIGKAKGLELLLRKKTGNATGWIGMSLAKTTRKFQELNNGEAFPYKFDRRFELTSLFQQRISAKWHFSATWALGTGNAYTLPESAYDDHEGNTVFVYGAKNSFREKPYHRLDVAFSYHTKRKKYQAIWEFAIINIYNRKNTYYFFTRYEDGTGYHNGTAKLFEQHQFPIMPSVSCTIKF